MTNNAYVRKIMAMSPHELLQHVLLNPEELTDPYYREFRDAIFARAEALNLWKAK